MEYGVVLTQSQPFQWGGWYRRGQYMCVTTHVEKFGLPLGYEYDFADSRILRLFNSGHIEIEIKVKGWAEICVIFK